MQKNQNLKKLRYKVLSPHRRYGQMKKNLSNHSRTLGRMENDTMIVLGSLKASIVGIDLSKVYGYTTHFYKGTNKLLALYRMACPG